MPQRTERTWKSCLDCVTWIKLYYFSDKISRCSPHHRVLSRSVSARSFMLSFGFYFILLFLKQITVGHRHLMLPPLHGWWQRSRVEGRFFFFILRLGRAEQTQPPSQVVNSISTFYLSSRPRASASNMAARHSVTPAQISVALLSHTHVDVFGLGRSCHYSTRASCPPIRACTLMQPRSDYRGCSRGRMTQIGLMCSWRGEWLRGRWNGVEWWRERKKGQESEQGR